MRIATTYKPRAKAIRNVLVVIFFEMSIGKLLIQTFNQMGGRISRNWTKRFQETADLAALKIPNCKRFR